MKSLDKYRVVAVRSMHKEMADRDPTSGRTGALSKFASLAKDVMAGQVALVEHASGHGKADFVIDAYVIPRHVLEQLLRGKA